MEQLVDKIIESTSAYLALEQSKKETVVARSFKGRVLGFSEINPGLVKTDKHGYKGQGVFGFDTMQEWVSEMVKVTTRSCQDLNSTLSNGSLYTASLFGVSVEDTLPISQGTAPPFLSETLIIEDNEYYIPQGYTNRLVLQISGTENTTIEIGENVVAISGDFYESYIPKKNSLELIINSDYITLYDIYWLFPILKSVKFNGKTECLEKAYYSALLEEKAKLKDILPKLDIKGLTVEKLQNNGTLIDFDRNYNPLVLNSKSIIYGGSDSVATAIESLLIESKGQFGKINSSFIDTVVYDINDNMTPNKSWAVDDIPKTSKSVLKDCRISRLILDTPVEETVALSCIIDTLIITDGCTSISNGFYACTFTHVEGLENVKEFNHAAFKYCSREKEVGAERWDIKEHQKLDATAFYCSEDLLTSRGRMRLKKQQSREV